MHKDYPAFAGCLIAKQFLKEVNSWNTDDTDWMDFM
jgi:hypothetical protein